MSEPTYRLDVRAPGDCRVFGPSLIEFDPFRFVNVGAEERAALLVRLLNEAFEAGRLASSAMLARLEWCGGKSRGGLTMHGNELGTAPACPVCGGAKPEEPHYFVADAYGHRDGCELAELRAESRGGVE